LEVSADGKLSWEESECLGACVNAPMIMIGNDTYEDLTRERFEEILESFRAGNGKSVPVGTQIPRLNSAAEGGATTLLEAPTAERTYKAFPPPPPPAAPAGAPVTAPAAVPPAAAAANAAAAPGQEPTNKGRGSEISQEGLPGLKGPPNSPKLPLDKVEAEREKAHVESKADGTADNAMRENATGAESPGGKFDGGKAPRKPRAKKGAPPEGAS
ncbi:MAG TPA: NAD(P)H-dependent oxidoreductase subunit E, partial [Devosia sp.]|nr:NAD(P)H-dependent oxidoreductase subunit E [Devosia sp.]